MEESHAELLTDILEDVVQSGTGTRAAIGGREVAGKTGTTDNYGDAWFVGYTPELVVAVWVGYPDALRPMLTEFNGEEVAGGTLPALIWKAFVEKVPEDDDLAFDSPALPRRHLAVGRPPRAASGSSTTATAAARGSSRTSPASAPSRRPTASRTRSSVPLVVGMTKAGAEAELAAQPLEANVAYSPAMPGKFPGLVVNQDPRRGGLSANDSVTIFVTTAKHGILPNFVGSSLADVQRGGEATQAATRRENRSRPRGDGRSGRCRSRESRPLRGCGSGSWSGTAHEARAGEGVAPEQVGRARDADPRRRHDLDLGAWRLQREGRLDAGPARRARPRCRAPASGAPARTRGGGRRRRRDVAA